MRTHHKNSQPARNNSEEARRHTNRSADGVVIAGMHHFAESSSLAYAADARLAGEPIPVQERDSFFQRVDCLAFGLTVTIVLIVYLFTLAPSVTFENSGVYATAAVYGGVNCAPGFPLWTLYAGFFTKLLPFSNIAWRIGISSALAGALACGIISLMVSRGGAMILEGMDRFRRLRFDEERRLRIIAAVVAGTTFGFHRSFWGRAVTVDPAPFTVLLLTATLCLLLRWAHSPERTRRLCAAFLVYGLTLSSEPYLAVALLGFPFVVVFRKPSLGRDFFFAISAILLSETTAVNLGYLPGFVGVIALQPICRGFALISTLAWLIMTIITRRLLTEWKTLCLVGFVFCCGCSFYLCVPIASMTNPPLNWDYARSVEGLIHVLGMDQYEHSRCANAGCTPFCVEEIAWRYLKVSVHDVGIIPLLPAVIPFLFLRRVGQRERGWMLGLVAVHFCLSFLLSGILNRQLVNEGRSAGGQYFPPSHVILAIWEGYGLCLLGTVVARKRLSKRTRLDTEPSLEQTV